MLTPEQYERAHALAEEALEQPSTERDAFVRSRCSDDPVLLEETLALVRAGATLEDATADVGPGTIIKAYRLVSEIGRGGMGTVYLAERADNLYTERVAIKIVARSQASAEVIARFRRERQILANLEHNAIPRIRDADALPDGRPFFVMDFVPGRPLTDFADQRQLSVRERVELAVKLCDVVTFVHSRHVVHRDLKPRNVLVTDEGQLKLLDFGIARTFGPQGDTRLTRTGIVPATPLYASPEQLRGELVDARSDIYALGVILFELLTGWWPFVAREPGQVPSKPSEAFTKRGPVSFRGVSREPPSVESIATARSTTPTGLIRELRGGLDGIVTRALSEDPLGRYDSVDDVANDLRRWVRGEKPTYNQPRSWPAWPRYAAAVALFGLACAGVFALMGQPGEPDQTLATVGIEQSTPVATPTNLPSPSATGRVGGAHSTYKNLSGPTQQGTKTANGPPGAAGTPQDGGHPAPSPQRPSGTVSAGPDPGPIPGSVRPPEAEATKVDAAKGRDPRSDLEVVENLARRYPSLLADDDERGLSRIYPKYRASYEAFLKKRSMLSAYQVRLTACQPNLEGDTAQVTCEVEELETPLGGDPRIVRSRLLVSLLWHQGRWEIQVAARR